MKLNWVFRDNVNSRNFLLECQLNKLTNNISFILMIFSSNYLYKLNNNNYIYTFT